MHPIADFFRRHYGVPATDSGPSWSEVDHHTLLAWFDRLAPIVRCGWHREQHREATAAERCGYTPLYQEIVAEVKRRANQADASAAMMAAACRASLPSTMRHANKAQTTMPHKE